MSKRPRIVLTMIVRQEAKVIRRCLESVRAHIDAWSISDTGSTDGTQDIIRECLAGIPGQLLERPWTDFATNRNEAIDAGLQFEPDYFLTLDADEELTTSVGFSLGDLTTDTYSAMFEMEGTAARWPRKVLFRSHLRYKFVLDETIVGFKSEGMLPACLVKSYTDGARSSAGMAQKYERDCEVLRRAVEREPDEPRYWYYLAQRLAGAGKYEEAIEAFKRRLAIESGLFAERGYCEMVIGQCLQALDAPFHEIQAAYLKSWQTNPLRAEPLFALGCLHSIRGEHALAELYARACHRIQRPNDPLPVDDSIYAYRAVDLMAGAIAEQGRAGEARDLLEKLLVLPQLPAEEHQRVRDNIALLSEAIGDVKPVEKVGPDEQTYENQAKALRERGLSGFRHLALEYLSSFQAQSLPSPLRWLWLVLIALFGRAVPVLGAIAAVPVAAWAFHPITPLWPMAALASGSPLLFLAGRRRLQDAPVAAVTLAALGFALRGDALGLGLAVFTLLGLKEAAILTVPALAGAWLWSGAPWSGFAIGTGAGCCAAALALLALFGGMAPAMLKAGSKGHATPYTLDHQRGAWHRLLVDLVLVSPITTLAALFGPAPMLAMVALLLGAHLIAPVRNVRLVLAADILLRCAAIAAFGWWIAPALVVDLYISSRLRPVYDPVTAALTTQLGMAR
ncbi:MAG TPA: glycosyltransferase [Polyangiaceae bacterium]|nr:glycosyltransferase [Polyangiaceae bacterium]